MCILSQTLRTNCSFRRKDASSPKFGPFGLPFIIALLTGLALACGSAAPAAPQPGVTETVREVGKVVEVEKLVVVTPTPVPEDPNAIVRREKLTILTSSFGN